MQPNIVDQFAFDISNALAAGRLRSADLRHEGTVTATPRMDRREFFGMPIDIGATIGEQELRTSFWVGLNVWRIFTIYLVRVDRSVQTAKDVEAFAGMLLGDVYRFTFEGAAKVGYSPTYQVCGPRENRFLSIVATAMLPSPLLPGQPDWQFWTNDVAMQTYSFVQSSLCAGLEIEAPFHPVPL